jgi:hypothetical protein
MRCWECGAVPNIVPDDSPVHVVCTCGKDLGWLQPKPKAPPLPKPALKPTPRDHGGEPEAEQNRRVVDADGYTGGICIALLGLIFIAGAVFYFWQADEALATMNKAEGNVIHGVHEGSGRSRRFRATVQFVTADGNTLQGQFIMASSTRVGDRVKVLYDPADPGNCREGSFNALYGFAWAAIGLGFVLLGVGLISIYRQATRAEEYQQQVEEDEARHGSRFPAVCACCAKGKPAGTWRVYGPTTTVEGPAATVHTTPFVEVPICSSCRWKIYRTFALAAVVGLAVGAIAFALVFLQFYEDSDIKTVGAGATLAGVFLGALAGALMEYLTRDKVTLGRLEPETDVIEFKNQAYQALYYEHLVKMGAGPMQHAGKLGSMLGR